MSSESSFPTEEKKRLNRLTSKIISGKYKQEDADHLEYLIWYWFEVNSRELIDELKQQGTINLIKNCKSIDEFLKWIPTYGKEEIDQDLKLEYELIRTGNFHSIDFINEYLQEYHHSSFEFKESVVTGANYLLNKLKNSKNQKFNNWAAKYAVFSYLTEENVNKEIINTQNQEFENILKEHTKKESEKYFIKNIRKIKFHLDYVKITNNIFNEDLSNHPYKKQLKEDTLKELDNIIENNEIIRQFQQIDKKEYILEDEEAIELLKNKMDYLIKHYLVEYIMKIEKKLTSNNPQVIIDLLASNYNGNIKSYVKIIA